MLNYLSAPLIYPVSTAPLPDGVLALQNDGTIAAVFSAEEARAEGLEDIRKVEGALIPGLVNTHCHLELSHLKGKISEGTGLQAFVQQVMKHRDTAAERVLEAMQAADQQLFENGIVAVGDISNIRISRDVKLGSKIYYHTFIEALGFDPRQAHAVMQRCRALQQEFHPLTASVVPHAPYSVSKELFQLIKIQAEAEGDLLSMHNQETLDESLFFEKKAGAFLQLYERLGLDIGFFEASGKSSLQTVLPDLPDTKVLLVHNTLTAAADVEAAMCMRDQLYWCLCPNANLYIENQLPDVGMLMDKGLRLTLGTDSLASNHQLSVLAEMAALNAHAAAGSALDLETMLPWATLNGAEFLGLEAQYGSLETGKRPGINQVTGLENGRVVAASRVKRLY